MSRAHCGIEQDTEGYIGALQICTGEKTFWLL